MSKSLLILGDSHSACWRFIKENNLIPEFNIEIRGIGGATARGISNPNSSTKALPIWTELLKKRTFDYISIGLGEVDCNFMIWYRIENNNSTMEVELDKSIEPYCKFIDYCATRCKEVIIRGATLPTVEDYTKAEMNDKNLRGTIKANYRDRTDCILEFNNRMKKFALDKKYKYTDITTETINDKENLLKSIYRKPNDHHLPIVVSAGLWIWKFQKINIK